MSSEPTLPIGDALDVVRQYVTDPEVLKKIAAALNAAQRENAAAKAADKEAGTSKSNRYRLVVLVRGDSTLKPLVAGGAFVFAVPDGEEDVALSDTYSGEGLLQRFYNAVRAHNDAPKGKRGKATRKIKTFAEAIRYLKPKTIKGNGSAFKIKTTAPVEVVVVEKEEV